MIGSLGVNQNRVHPLPKRLHNVLQYFSCGMVVGFESMKLWKAGFEAGRKGLGVVSERTFLFDQSVLTETTPDPVARSFSAATGKQDNSVVPVLTEMTRYETYQISQVAGKLSAT